MKVVKEARPLVFQEGDQRVCVRKANRGEPFRSGVELSFESDHVRDPQVFVLLDFHEVETLRDKLTEFLGGA